MPTPYRDDANHIGTSHLSSPVYRIEYEHHDHNIYTILTSEEQKQIPTKEEGNKEGKRKKQKSNVSLTPVKPPRKQNSLLSY